MQRTRFESWSTTDEEEVERRRRRAAVEPMAVRCLEPSYLPLATFAVASGDGDSDEGREYRVEIRSLTQRLNSCSCPDHRINGLGTCKHVEAVLLFLERDGGSASSPGKGRRRLEVFLERAVSPPRVRLLRPPGRRSRQVEELLAPLFGEGNDLLAPPESAVPALARLLQAAPKSVRQRVRLSSELSSWAEAKAWKAARQAERDSFLADVRAGKRSLKLLRHPLYSYQEEGALHLAFAGRALLGDEMGLGKTVQAIAACELLRRLQGIERVLVICPVSLKAEWEEQIAKFTDLPTLVVLGPRAFRLRQYRKTSFFYLTNYEQVLSDGEDIQRLLAPDVIILDEAQRIKNWRTKTAQAVKRLESRYAFVLTGTPLENRIDDLYSIAQFLDPGVFGPLFRFNRDFHQLDERGRPVGYKNLAQLHHRLRPVLLRRRKSEVEEQLPGRTVNTYFVAMHQEQAARYGEYEERVARIAAIAKRRPLTRKEFEKLQLNLGCMRMVCDTPYILDPDCRICPKLTELEPILEELLGDTNQKVLIFSEWERMLELVQELATRMKVGFAWHTGSVPQGERRQEIRRFKSDPACRLFLSTDSGSVGLNLQAASAVINLDLPWNPAKLEQRIARAWRKHQTRPVQVIHLVTEDSIEQRMLGILAGKQALADGILDGAGGVDEMPLPSGRAVFLQRLEEILELRLAAGETEREPAAPAPEQLRQDLLTLLGERLLLLDLLPRERTERSTVLAVVDGLGGDGDSARQEVESALRRCFGEGSDAPRLELLDRSAFDDLRRLAEAGVIELSERISSRGEPLHRSTALTDRQRSLRLQRLQEAREAFALGERKLRMARLLAGNGFGVEALPPLREAVEQGLLALARLAGTKGETLLDQSAHLEAHYGQLALDGLGLLGILQAMKADDLEEREPVAEATEHQDRGEALLRRIEETLDRAALGSGP